MKGCDKVPTGSKIKELRKEKGLTQKQLSEKCGMYESQIRKYENGNANPKIETLQKIAGALEVPLYKLLQSDETIKIDGKETHPIDLTAFNNPKDINNIIKSINSNKPIPTSAIKELVEAANPEDIETDEALIKQRTKYYSLYDKLNAEGKEKAVERVSELAEIARFKKVIDEF